VPGGVLFLDLDGRLDAARLPVALSQRIAACRAAAGQPTGVTQGATHGWPLCAPDDPVYGPSLERFRLLRCRTSAEVVRAAAVLDRLVSGAARVSNHSADDDAGHRADEAPTRLLLIDNLVRRVWRTAPSVERRYDINAYFHLLCRRARITGLKKQLAMQQRHGTPQLPCMMHSMTHVASIAQSQPS